MEQRTYMRRELAALLGVSPKDVGNAKDYKAKSPRPGSAVHTVIEGMRERGIVWAQIVPDARGRKPGAGRGLAEAFAGPVPAPPADHGAGGPEIDPDGEDRPDPLVDDRAREPEEAPAPDAPPSPGRAVAAGPDAGFKEFQQRARRDLMRHSGRLAPDAESASPGDAMTLEEIIAQFRRRLPGVTITINL